ncbi:SpoIID/LytB domain protein [Neobacillus niacini]|uniref:SpoIID/LytB domain-containing protein n=1 Tax=Neobacillus driksii TaxID=3035913 RepID=UPI002788C42B|nr:SpoIID/LytB domain-containing protein [Neobacillus niacini]MDQ0974588.1 SpoIID/LytB domain protein [Neobacillus niacini]
MKKLRTIFLIGILLLGLLPMKMVAEASMVEPKLQVKLVNYLGNQTSISLRVSGSYSLDGTSTKLSSVKTYSVKAEQSKISLYDGSTKLITAEDVSITPENEKYTASINSREYHGSFNFIVENGYVRPINNIYLEEYLKSVVPAEMYASWNKEALKVQAVAARTYAYYRLGKVINDTTSYQVYGGADMLHPNSTAAVLETAGEIVTYNGRAIDALFSASNGGMSESNYNEFGSPALPYFPIQRDDFDKKLAWETSIQKQQINLTGLDLKNPNLWWNSTSEKDSDFTAKIKSWLNQNGYSNKQIKIVNITNLSFYDKTESGRVQRGDLGFQFLVKDRLDSTGKLQLLNGDMTNVIADRIRSYIGTSVMRSTLITEVINTSSAFSFSGLGFGHGVGLSQHGANNRVNAGHRYHDILAFYYPGTKLVKQYELHQEAPVYPPVKVQLNGYDFNTGYSIGGHTYVNWNALKMFAIPYTYQGDGVFLIEGRTVKAKSIDGAWYINWYSMSPGKITAEKITGGYNFIYTTPTKIQLNGVDFAEGGYFHNGTTYINWNALKTLKIPYIYKGSGVFVIEGRSVKAKAFNGDWYIEWKELSPGRITAEKISGGYNFTYTNPIKIQLNGIDFAKGGHALYGATYIHWTALQTLKIPYSDKGNGVFVIEGRTVQAVAVNGEWYINWYSMSPGKITYEKITGGYNFTYTNPIKIQFNGIDFAKGGHALYGATHIHWTALQTLKIPYSDKGKGVFVIEGRTIQAVAVNGEWYINWYSMSPGKITYEKITGGYNFIYKP